MSDHSNWGVFHSVWTQPVTSVLLSAPCILVPTSLSLTCCVSYTHLSQVHCLWVCICDYLVYSCSSQLLFSNASCSSIANYLIQWSIQTFPIHPLYLQTQSLKAISHATLLKWWGPEETEYSISVPLFFQICGKRVVWHCFLFRGIFFQYL